MDAPESARKESLLAPTLDLLKSPTAVGAGDLPLLIARPTSADAPGALSKKQQQQMVEDSQGWIFETRDHLKKSTGAQSLQNSDDGTGNGSKSPAERYLDARAQGRRDAGTNSYNREFGNDRYSDPSGKSGHGPNASGDSATFGGASLDGSADLLGRGQANDSLPGLDGEKMFQRMGTEYRERVRDREAGFAEYRKIFDPAPNNTSPSGQSGIDAARQSGAPFNLQGLGDFSHRSDGGANGYSYRGLGGSGSGGSLFDTGRPFGSSSLQPPQIPAPAPPPPPRAPSSFDLPRREF
jgi:hypothetical protein